MILKKGSNGGAVKRLQKFLKTGVDGIFGPETEKAVKKWQRDNGLKPDGLVGLVTLDKMDLFDETYKKCTIQGSAFPGKPIKSNLKIELNACMINEYLPELKKAMGNDPKGFQLLCTIMAHHEGFKEGTRSYRTNNPGNIGNTDRGRNKCNSTLKSGILLQKKYILKIVNGKHSAYPLNATKIIRPYCSPEIARNSKTYGMSPYLPGYKFKFTGQIDQFVKIYSTAARGGNSYLSMIISYFKQHEINIRPDSKIQNIIKLT